MNIKLSQFGCSLSSRLKGREVFASIKSDIIPVEKIVLDFKEIEIMTLSFGTELFDSLSQNFTGEIEVVNTNDFINNIVSFCRNNIKEMAI
jgi:hypothetical protein